MQIVIVRHLPTPWNQKNILQGKRDLDICPPSREMLRKIKQNKQFIKQREPFDHILASTLKRTLQTAVLYGCEPEREPLLDEFDFGPYEGKPKRLLLKKHKDDWFHHPLKITFGEGIPALQKRISSFLEKYSSASSLLLFSHGTWTRALLSYCRCGHLNNMNKFSIKNNDCIALEYFPGRQKRENGGFSRVRTTDL